MFNTGTDVLSVSLPKWLYIASRGILHLVIAMCFRSLDLDGAVCLVPGLSGQCILQGGEQQGMVAKVVA